MIISIGISLPEMQYQFSEIPIFDAPGSFGLELENRLLGAVPAIIFPVAAQQYSAFQPLGFVTTYRDGWQHEHLDYLFAKPFPVNEQPFGSGSGKGSVPTWFA